MTKEEELLKRMTRARINLINRQPFLGHLALRLSIRIARPEEGVPTAGVASDGTMVVSEPFCSALTDAQLRGLMAHEVLHVAFLFWARRLHRDHALFNRAHDYAINAILMDLYAASAEGKGPRGLELPPGALYSPRFAGLSAEEIYSLLLSEGEPASSGQPGEGTRTGSLSDGEGAVPFDATDCRDEFASTDTGKKAARGDSTSRNQLAREWQIAVELAMRQHRDLKGSLPGSLLRLVEELKAPCIDWRDVLSQFLGSKSGGSERTFMAASRRDSGLPVRLPGMRKTLQPDVTILWDTSGSMGPEEIAVIMAEVCEILTDRGMRARLIVADAAVHADEEVGDVEDIVPLLIGGGGSDFCPAFELLQKERDTSLIVAFTDGYINVPSVIPDMASGVLWVVTEGGTRPASWGRAIRFVNKTNVIEI